MAKKNDIKRVYTYQNLSLEDMSGEEWVSIEGYEEYYMVSNYGRIKSLGRKIEFVIPGRHTVSFWRPEKILRQGKVSEWNQTVKERFYSLSVTFCVAQEMDTRKVSRLVFNAFVDKADFEKDGLYVIHKDGDGLNNRADNLELSSRSEAVKLSYNRGRAKSVFESIDMKQVAAKSAKTRQKTITQYGLNGKRIRVYKSLKDAEKATGVHHSNISLAAKGKKLQRGGFIWRYGRGERNIDVSFYKEAKQCFRERQGTVVSQYSMQGEKIATYSSIAEASECSGARDTAISSAIAGKYDTAGGYVWRAGNGPARVNMRGYKTRIEKMILKKAKPVVQYNLKGKKVSAYVSIAEAARETGYSAGSIRKAAVSGEVFKGQYWKFG